MNAVTVLLAAMWGAAGVAQLLMGRLAQGLAAIGVSVTLSVVTAAGQPFGAELAIALGVIAGPLVAPLAARAMTTQANPNRGALLVLSSPGSA